MNWTQRVQQLLEQLEERARQCPGLYPVFLSTDFHRIVLDYLEQNRSRKDLPLLPEETALCLEEIWRNPEFCVQLNAHSLIRRGASPFNQTLGKTSPGKAAG